MKKVIIFLTTIIMFGTAKAYDFSAVAPSGQILYYNITNSSDMIVSVAGSNAAAGALVIPDSVIYNGHVYSVNTIGYLAFANNSGLISVTIPNSITEIEASAFRNCTNLTSVSIGNSVTFIGQQAFLNCGSLTIITIPNSVASIGSSAFGNCSGLNTVNFNATNCNTMGSPSINLFVFTGCSNLNTLNIGNNVINIPDGAFFGCNGLISVIIPNTVTNIGQFAFQNCTGLTSVMIPNSVTNIGQAAFANCSGLVTVTIPNSVISVGPSAFASCTGLTTVIIGNSVTNLGESSFYNCSNLTSVTIGNSVTSIGSGVFRSCTSLDSIDIPNSVTNIGESAFGDCSNLIYVNLSNSVDSIKYGTFTNCTSLVSIIIPNSVTYIGRRAFYRCRGLESVIIGSDVNNIGQAAFYDCSNLNTVYMMPEMPPTLVYCDFVGEVGYPFDGYPANNCIFKLVGCSYDSYFSSPSWSNYRYYLDDPDIDIILNISVADGDQGTASINTLHGHDVRCDSSAVITATPAYGYHFSHWSNGNVSNPDTLHLIGDSSIIAYFSPNSYTVTVVSSDNALGTVSGGGMGNYLDTMILSATCTEPHYHFVRWSDGNTDNPRIYQVTGDVNITAIFAIDTHYVNVTCDIARGTVRGSGYYAYGSACTVTAENIYTGFVFHSWSNGVTANPYVFAVLGDIELYAIFVAEGEEVYTVTVESADPSMGTASGGGQALSGGEVVIWATSNPGHRFVRWNDNNTDSVRTVVVTANVTYTAYFEATTQGINEVMENDTRIYVQNGQIIVEGVDDKTVRIFDMYGRLVDNRMLPTGVYLVKIGDHPARKVVVIR